MGATMKHRMAANGVMLLSALSTFPGAYEAAPVPVNVRNFARWETDMVMGKAFRDGAFGQLRHRREPGAINQQVVVRMNRDTLGARAASSSSFQPSSMRWIRLA
jgi:hypothetical protein